MRPAAPDVAVLPKLRSRISGGRFCEPPPPEARCPQLTVELGKAEIQSVEIEPAIEHLRAARNRRLGDPQKPRRSLRRSSGTALAFTNRPVDGVADNS